MKTRASLGLGVVALVLAGCIEQPQTGAGLYGEYCASCHGADARGGPEIDPPAPDLTTLARRHGGTYPAVFVMSTIDGYAREATHGPMPIFGALLDGRVETWVDADGTPTPTPVSLILLNEYLAGQQES
ncbi:MAG: hypothetical protein AUK37_06150 [Rhodobacterales bacterium CG2_30_65_12]|nr:MAG: hypothetical protein AUK37_06150 [Rhodobacterales bacterium CG2_30_65_12]